MRKTSLIIFCLAAFLLPGRTSFMAFAQSDLPAEKEFTVNGFTFKMVLVEGAVFNMGAQPHELVDGDLDEQIVHKVKVNSFYMLTLPVTEGFWYKVLWGDQYEWSDNSNRPITINRKSYTDSFFWDLEQKTGCKFRLPTEAEWEFAARGGRKTRGCRYSGSNRIDEVAIYGQRGWDFPNVGQKKPNELGLYDMSGLIWELCSDFYNNYPDMEEVLDNPEGPAEDSGLFVIRGGCYKSDKESCRVVKRWFIKDGGDTEVGLRIVLDAVPRTENDQQ